MAIQISNKTVNLIKYNDAYVQTGKMSTGQFIYPNYVRNGLKVWLDAQCNTRAGFSSTSATWEDLSGNDNDFTISGGSYTNHFGNKWSYPNVLRNTNTFTSISSSLSTTTWSAASGGNGTVAAIVISDPPQPNINRGFKITGNTSGNRDGKQQLDTGVLANGTACRASWWARGKGTVQFRIWNSTDNKAQFSTTKRIDSGTTWVWMDYSFTGSSESATDTMHYQLGVTGTSDIEFCGMCLWAQSSYRANWIPNTTDSDYTTTTGRTNNSFIYNIKHVYPRGEGAACKIYKDISTDFPDPFTTSAWTFEFCVTPLVLENYLSLFRTVTDSNYREAWIPSDGKPVVRVYNNTSVTSGTAVQRQRYYTITITRSGTTGSQTNKIYLNGVQVASTATSLTTVSNTRLYIFSRNADQYNFRGEVHGFRYYNRALTAAEVLENYTIDKLRFDPLCGVGDPISLYYPILSATCTQGSNSYGTQVTQTYTAPTGATGVYFIEANYGTSYGACETILQVNTTTVANRTRTYNGSGYSDSGTIVTLNSKYNITAGQNITLKIRASYNPDVSGQFQSTSSFKFYFVDSNNNMV